MPSLPYLTSPGNFAKAMEGIKNAATPPRVSQDFVKTILQIPGGSGDNMTTFLKRIGFAQQDGAPTERYRKFRNEKTSGIAIAEAMREAYSEIFKRNEFAYSLGEDEIRGHVVEITGNAADARNVSLTVTTFLNMRDMASFSNDSSNEDSGISPQPARSKSFELPSSTHEADLAGSSGKRLGMNIGYTINLNLPATSDVAVFKSLKENLLNDK